jgi:RNA polymerase sigma factor (sigma-70 family)
MHGSGEWDDSKLVELARAGNQAAFAALFVRHRPLLLRLCQRVLGGVGLAEDAVQEAALRALINLDSLRRPERFGPWLAGIGLHVCRQWLRYQSREAWSLDARRDGDHSEPAEDAAGPEVWAEAAELARWVAQAVASLPAGQRNAISLFYLEGLTHAETATALGVGVGAVKTRLHKARGALRSRLEAEEDSFVSADLASEFVEVHVEDVFGVPAGVVAWSGTGRRSAPSPPPERRVVLLAEDETDRVLPIWVGVFEGDSIAVLLVGAETRRPLTFPFAAQLLAASGASLREVRVVRLTDETFYAEVEVEGLTGATSFFDARPSDAISLALVTGAPIRIARSVLDQAGVNREDIRRRRPPESRSAMENAEGIRKLVSESTIARPSVF